MSFRARVASSANRPGITVLGVGVALGIGYWGASGREPVLTTPPRVEEPAERALGCAICGKMIESLPPGEFSRDPHAFACAVCHHPHTRRTTEGWRKTCSQDGCHPRAWTRTVFHRLDAAVFVNCMNCHGVHEWSLDGANCRSCHGAFADSVGSIPVTKVAGVTRFEHARHRSVECAACHASLHRHGELALSSSSDCSTCHHVDRKADSCASCHGGLDLAFSRQVEMTMALSVGDGPRTREATFPHGIHARKAACTSCHPDGGAGRAECAACHEGHHEGSADCRQCHGAPPVDAHDISVHQAECTDCHEKGPARPAEPPRTFCLSCHRTMADHNPEDRCTQCHDPASITGD